MTARDPGMPAGAFRNALRGNPDASRIGMDMLLDASGQRFQPGVKSDKLDRRRKAAKAARRNRRTNRKK